MLCISHNPRVNPSKLTSKLWLRFKTQIKTVIPGVLSTHEDGKVMHLEARKEHKDSLKQVYTQTESGI